MGSSRTLARLPWPLRSVIAGAAGTGTLTLAYMLDRRLRPRGQGPADYDDSLVPGAIVASILHLQSVSSQEEADLGLALRWGYGSMFGIWHGLLRRKVGLGEPSSTLVFGTTLMSATLTMFPLLGHTPPPWRWPRGYLLTSFSTHVAYAVAVAAVDARLERR